MRGLQEGKKVEDGRALGRLETTGEFRPV